MAARVDVQARRFAEFVRDLQEPGTAILSPQRLCERLNLPIQAIAERAHVNLNTVTLAPESESLQAYLRKVVRVLSAASEINGGDLDGTIAWFRDQPIPELLHKTADELVSEGRTDAVVAYIESIASGYVG